MMGHAVFITGIDTDAGKSYATGWLARQLAAEGQTVITQKFIQTGCDAYSEDIDLHRRIMGTGLLPEDADHTTAPIVLTYPASAQLAARIDGREIDLDAIDRSTAELTRRFDTVLIEGAGGLMVPITDDFFAIDYVVSRRLPVMLVTNSRLGSINHTVLALEAIKARGIKLEAVLYNTYFDSAAGKPIADDTRGFVERYVERHFPGVPVIDIPDLNLTENL